MRIRAIVDFASVAAPKVVGGVLTIALNAVLLRYFGSAQFGVYSLCVAGILLADGILGSAIDMGVLRLASSHRETDPIHSAGIEKAALLLKLGGTLALSVVLLAFAGPVSRMAFQEEGRESLLYLSCFAAISMLALRSVLVHLQMEGRFALYGTLDLLHYVLKFGGVGVLLLLHRVSPTAVLIFFGVAPFCAFVIGLRVFAKSILAGGKTYSGHIGELLSFVKWSLLTFCLAALISRLDLFFLAGRSTIQQVGIYSGGQVFALIPELLGSYLAILLSPRIMPYCKDGVFYSFFRKFQFLCFAACLAIYAVTMAGIQFISPVLFPATFVRSLDIFLILLPGALAGLATFPLTISFLMFLRPKFLFTMDCLTLPFIVVLYAYAIQSHGAIGAAWVTSGTRFFKAGVAQFVAWKWARRTSAPGTRVFQSMSMPEAEVSSGGTVA